MPPLPLFTAKQLLLDVADSMDVYQGAERIEVEKNVMTSLHRPESLWRWFITSKGYISRSS